MEHILTIVRIVLIASMVFVTAVLVIQFVATRNAGLILFFLAVIAWPFFDEWTDNLRLKYTAEAMNGKEVIFPFSIISSDSCVDSSHITPGMFKAVFMGVKYTMQMLLIGFGLLLLVRRRDGQSAQAASPRNAAEAEKGPGQEKDNTLSST